MMELDTVPSIPLFDDLFDAMVIAGQEGLAVSKESLDKRECVTIGRDSQGKCVKNILRGEPYKVASSVVVPIDLFHRINLLLDGPFKRNGMIAADTLDGVSYLVKWVVAGTSIRLVISNPEELSTEVQDFVAKIEQLLAELT